MKTYSKFLALGDSIISDDYPGPGLGAASLLHSNNDERFPEYAGKDLLSHHPGIEFTNVSKTGWMIRDLLVAISSIPSAEKPTLVVICIGGNDLLHGYAGGIAIPQVLEVISSQLSTLVEEVRARFAKLDLRLVNAYDPTDGSGKFQSGRTLPEGPQAVSALNGVIAQIAGPDLVDIHSHCLGHGIRHKDADYQHFEPEDPSGWFKMDIEPNNRGAHEIRRKIWESL